MSANTPDTEAATPDADLLDDVLAEVQDTDISRSSKATSQRSHRATRMAKAPRNWGHVMAISSGVLLVLVAGILVVWYVMLGVRNQAAEASLKRLESEQGFLEGSLISAEEMRSAKDFSAAVEAYKDVTVRARPLLRRLEEDTRKLRPGELKARAEAAVKKVGEFIRKAEEGLNAPDVLGLVEHKGQWVTPEERDKRITEEMKAAGKTLYKGEWFTESELREARGEVLYMGRWMASEERDRLVAADRTRTVISPQPVTDEPPARLPKVTLRPADFKADMRAWVLNDFETPVHNWSGVPWQPKDANPCKLSIARRNEGGQLKLALASGKSDKSAIVRSLGLDFTSRSRLVLDVQNNCGEPIRLAVAFHTDEYYESRWKPLRIGANKNVRFNLTTGDFKCDKTHWTTAARIGKPELVTQFYILVYYNGKGEVLLDNIALLGGD